MCCVLCCSAEQSHLYVQQSRCNMHQRILEVWFSSHHDKLGCWLITQLGHTDRGRQESVDARIGSKLGRKGMAACGASLLALSHPSVEASQAEIVLAWSLHNAYTSIHFMLSRARRGSTAADVVRLSSTTPCPTSYMIQLEGKASLGTL